MSITAANLTDGTRVDQITQKGSIIDVIAVITRKKGHSGTARLSNKKYSHFSELKGQKMQLKAKDVQLNREQLDIDGQRF